MVSLEGVPASCSNTAVQHTQVIRSACTRDDAWRGTHSTSSRSISGAPRPCPGSSPNLVRSKPGASGQAVNA